MKTIFYFIEGLSLKAFNDGLTAFKANLNYESVEINNKVTSSEFIIYKTIPVFHIRTAAELRCTVRDESTGVLLEAHFKYKSVLLDLTIILVGLSYAFTIHSLSWLWVLVVIIYPVMIRHQLRELKRVFLEIPAFIYERRSLETQGKAGDDHFH